MPKPEFVAMVKLALGPSSVENGTMTFRSIHSVGEGYPTLT